MMFYAYMASHRTRKCDKFNLKLLGSILAGAVHFVRKETHSDNVMPYKTSQIAGIFYLQIGTHKSAKKDNFCIIRFCPTFSMSYRKVCPQQKCKETFCCNLFRV